MRKWGKHLGRVSVPSLVAATVCFAPGAALAEISVQRLSGTLAPALGSTAIHRLHLSPLSALLFRSMNLGSWNDLTVQALLPDFAANLGYRVELDVSLLAKHEFLLLPEFLAAVDSPPSTAISFEFSASRVPETPLVSSLGSRLLAYASPGHSFERSLFSSGFTRQVGSGAIDVAAVFARQGYATWGLGSTAVESRYPALESEQSSGSGLRLGFSSELAPGVEFGAAYQSRIDMDTFNAYRGVYSEPGDFDIPASANLGIVVQATPKSSLSFDVQRVLYSEVNTFTSSLLPDRFLSLLGDSASPDFAWRDLTIYRVGWNWRSSEDFTWQVVYSTSQQPTPTSDSLARALEPEFADRNMSFGFSTRTGRSTRLNVSASYADSIYYLGNSNYTRSGDLTGDQFEFEVIWVWDF